MKIAVVEFSEKGKSFNAENTESAEDAEQRMKQRKTRTYLINR